MDMQQHNQQMQQRYGLPATLLMMGAAAYP
jgi:hypothetical protein